MDDDDFDSLISLLRPLTGEIADSLWLASLIDPACEKDMHAVARAIAAELFGQDFKDKLILLPPPPSHILSGKYPLGNVMYANNKTGTLHLRESELSTHLCILGRSGSGKTNLGHIIVWNLLKTGKPFLVFDWRRNYAALRELPGGESILKFSPGLDTSLSFNPLTPPESLCHAQREAYIRDTVSVIINTLMPGSHLLSASGAEYLMMKAFMCLGKSEKPVTFNDIRRFLSGYHARSREADWKASAESVLSRLTTGPPGQLYNEQGIVNIADLLDSPVILELDSLGSEDDRSVFVNTFLLFLFYQRLAEGKSDVSKHILIIEEAHNVFKKNSRPNPVDGMIRQFRDLGEGLVLIDQNPSLLSIPSLGNTGTSICFNLKHGDDIRAAGKSMTLPTDRWLYLGKLPVGEAIVRLSDRWPEPMLVRFPMFNIPADSGCNKSNESKNHGDSREIRAEIMPRNEQEGIRAFRGEHIEEKNNCRIGSMKRDFLLDVGVYPLSTITERYERLGFSAHKGNKLKNSFIESGLIAQEKVPVKDGCVTLLKLSAEGSNIMGGLGFKVKKLPKNASLEHEYYKNLIAGHFRSNGYNVTEEYPLGEGKAVDVVAENANERLAIEVETGKSDIAANIIKCRESDFDKVLIFARDKPVKKKIDTIIERYNLDDNINLSVHAAEEVNSLL